MSVQPDAAVPAAAPERLLARAVAGVRELAPYEPGKPVEELERELGIRDIIKLASNENPLGMSSRVTERVAAALPELHRYPDGSAFRLKQALAEHLDVSPSQLTVGNGSNDVLDLAARAFLAPGCSAVMAQHCFVVYPIATQATGARAIVVPAHEYGHDLAAMAAAADDSTRMVFVANPNNPTGTWNRLHEVEQLLDALPDDVMVVLDVAYVDYVEEPDYPHVPDLLALLQRHPNLIVTRTFSKIHGLAGLRVGYAVSHPQVADLLNRVRAPFNVGNLPLVAAEAALGDEAFAERSREVNRTGMAQLIAGCRRLGLSWIPSAGNFVSIDVGRAAQPVFEALLREGVIVRPVGGYGLPNHLRVSVGLEAENRRFIDALGRVL